MSFRHTAITEFLYKSDREAEMDKIRNVLGNYGNFEWRQCGSDENIGYFHGVIKDLGSYETRAREQEIINAVKEAGADLKIVFES